jgi:copper chaperone CopZ
MQSAQVVYELNVEMVCDGCSGAVNRILGKVGEISNINIDVPNQKVFVTGQDGLDIAAMLQKWVSKK